MLASISLLLLLGLIASIGLGIASRVFYVWEDPKVLAITDELPGANCGGCGEAGCAAAAEAIAAGRIPCNACVVGGFEVAKAVAGIMGLEVKEREPEFAWTSCIYGVGEADPIYTYNGAMDCRAAVMLYGGSKLCPIGCIGLATCVNTCQFGALSMGDDNLPVVDHDRCVGCGACAKVCPKGIISLTSQTSRIQHIYTTDECTAPCQRTCPAGIDIPGYIRQIRAGNYREAVRIIKESNPFPLTCGRVCPHPCEDMCRLGRLDEPVNINHLKRFVADLEMHSGERIMPHKAPETGKRVAIIGGGPAGLTAAYYLARLGHATTIFEAMPKLGGMLRYGIPEYRLPKATLDWEIEGILSMGVEVKTGVSMGTDFTIKTLKDDGFDAIFIGTGAWDSRGLGVEGEDLNGILPGTRFLIDRGLGKETPVGDKVGIIGGGNTALDAARTCWRLGAKEVTIIYRRSRKEMPANDIEVEEAEKEGVKFHFLAAPTRLMGEEGRLTHMEFLEMALGEPDASGRRRPVPKEGTETIIEVDNVIAAIGQFPFTSFLTDDGVKTTRWNTIEVVNELTGETNIEGVFAGGDAASGASIAVEGIGAGRRAARSIHLYLSGEEVSPPVNSITKETHVLDADELIAAKMPESERARMPELSVDERSMKFDEVEKGLDEDMALKEAERCLQCGLLCYEKET